MRVKSAKVNLIVDDSVHTDGDGVPGEDLLRRNIECSSPEVHTPTVR